MAKVNVALTLEFPKHDEELVTEVAVELVTTAINDVREDLSGEDFYVLDFHVQSDEDGLWL